jgi:hypothetical protein
MDSIGQLTSDYLISQRLVHSYEYRQGMRVCGGCKEILQNPRADHFADMKGHFLLPNGLIEYQIGPDLKNSPVPNYKPKLDAHKAHACGR